MMVMMMMVMMMSMTIMMTLTRLRMIYIWFWMIDDASMMVLLSMTDGRNDAWTEGRTDRRADTLAYWDVMDASKS